MASFCAASRTRRSASSRGTRRIRRPNAMFSYMTCAGRRVALKHHRHVAAMRRHLGDRLLVEVEVAFGISSRPAIMLSVVDLPQARRSEQHQELAVRDIEAEVVHRDHAVGIALGDPIEAYACHGVGGAIP